MQFHKNAWHVVALPGDITRTMMRRVVMNEPVALYRSEAGRVIALRDRCPHRFAPLSRGRLTGDIVECGYHGLQFDSTGRCVFNPHTKNPVARNFVASYKAVERHSLVWIWMGDQDMADQNAIPDLSFMTAPQVRTVHQYLNANYRYDILVDNLMDLSHSDYLHVGSFMGGVCERSETTVRENGDDVLVNYMQWNAPAPPGRAETSVDQETRIHWRPGQIMSFELRAAPVGSALATGQKYMFGHIATPETERTTHYFMSITRDYALRDTAVDLQVAAHQMGAILNEDSPMLEAISAQMGESDLLEMRPAMLPTDAGGLRVRKVMKRLLEQQELMQRVAALKADPS